MTHPDLDAFARDGFAGPVQIYSPEECSDLFRRVTSSGKPRPKDWGKGQGAANESYYRAASDPRLLDLVTPILGPNVILWGIRTVIKAAGEVHAFHTDIEASSPTGRFVSIWVGLNNTGPKSGLKFVAGSHLFGKAVQQMELEKGLADVGEDTIVEWARQFTDNPDLVQPDVKDGSAIVFDGRVWHGSHNVGAALRRTALLIQYAAADEPVYIPKDFNSWPPEFELKTRPPVITVAGAPAPEANRVVDPPEAPLREKLQNSTHLLDKIAFGWNKPFASSHHLKGETSQLDFIESHTSLLKPGAYPHALHWHEEEELLVIISGEAALHIADDAQGTNERVELMREGDFIYYPAFLHHTLTNVGALPLKYTMFKWSNNAPKVNYDTSPSALIFRTGEELRTTNTDKRFYRKLFEQPTHWLHKLHAHLSVLALDGGYDAHTDAYDVAIVLLRGKVRSSDRTVTAPAVLFHPAGESHGLRNIGNQPARYIVFEFHGEPKNGVRPATKKPRSKKRPEKFGKRLLRSLARIFRR